MKAKFRVGQVVWDIEDDVPRVVESVRAGRMKSPSNFWYTYEGDIGITVHQSAVRGLSKKELGLAR